MFNDFNLMVLDLEGGLRREVLHGHLLIIDVHICAQSNLIAYLTISDQTSEGTSLFILDLETLDMLMKHEFQGQYSQVRIC